MEINVSPQAPGHVVDASDQDFEAKVLARSREVPVLVDFWAPWCQPCKVLGPALEKLAEQWAGRFELVKVNMDESPMLAQALRIQSIPAVKLFLNGHIQDEFVGAYPEPEIVRFLEHNLPSEQVDEAVAGLRRWQTGDGAGAIENFEQVLQSDPKNVVALIGLGHAKLDQGDLEGAREAVAAVNEVELEKLTDRPRMEKLLSILRSRIYLNEQLDPALEDADEVSRRFHGACRSALDGQFEPALNELLSIVQTHRKFRDDGARKAMLAVFDLMPSDAPLLPEFRQRLSNFLFS